MKRRIRMPHRLILLPVVAFWMIGGASALAAAPVQWPAAQGGNNHYYEWVPSGFITWNNASVGAAARTFGGVNGHLATMTTLAENTFFETNFSQNTGDT